MSDVSIQLSTARSALRDVAGSTDPAVVRLAASTAQLSHTLDVLARVSPELTFPPS